jgi:hypothetical protein
MAAICYEMIAEYVEESLETLFVSEYMDEGESPEYTNPNLVKLYKLIDDMRNVLDEEPIPEDRVRCIWQYMDQTAQELTPYGEENKNIASVWMAVLMALDLYIEETMNRGYRYTNDGPLNHTELSSMLVYYKSRESLLDDMKKKARFRTMVDCGGIRSVLKRLLIIKKEKCFPSCEYPQMKHLRIHSGRKRLREELETNRKLKIAMFPERIPGKFRFEKVQSAGSSFRVTYDNAQMESIAMYCRWIKYAVENKANFIVFPEFCVSGEILQGVKIWLFEQRREKWMKDSCLIAIFMGTTWLSSDNNVMHILDERGQELGVYYKYSPFTQLPKAEQGNTFELCECLKNPGKKSILLDIELVGRILPAICRDIIDGKYTEYFVSEFEPFMLVAATYSSSVTSFKRHFQSYASCRYVTSIMCNACEAVQGSALGVCAVPVKCKTEMNAYIREIPVCNPKSSICEESCCVMVTLYYKYNKGRMGPKIRVDRS